MERDVSEELLKSEEKVDIRDEEENCVENKYLPSRPKSFIQHVRKSKYQRLSKEARGGGRRSKSCCLCCVGGQKGNTEENPATPVAGEQETCLNVLQQETVSTEDQDGTATAQPTQTQASERTARATDRCGEQVSMSCSG